MLGIRRKCCGEYYCEECFYLSSECQSCGEPIAKKGLSGANDNPEYRANSVAVLTGWLLMPFLLFLGGCAVLIATTNELLTPSTLFNYKCKGYFNTCGNTVCLDLGPNSVLDGVQTIDSWEYCTLGSYNKMKGDICIYDNELYLQSKSMLGYDLCIQDFDNGALVFEDSFEDYDSSNTTNPLGSRMKSSLWETFQFAEVSGDCGGMQSESGGRSGGNIGLNSIILRGDTSNQDRIITSKYIDVQYGGRVRFHLKMAPLSGSYPDCMPAITSTVYLNYQVFNSSPNSNNDEWNILSTYSAVYKRSNKFSWEDIKIPDNAISNQTRFQFYQIGHENARDHVAIDNFEILHYFKSGYRYTDTFKEREDESKEEMDFAACCFDTERCQLKLSEDQRDRICNRYSGYTDSKPYFFRGVELYVFLGACVKFALWIYTMTKEFFVLKKVPFANFINRILTMKIVEKYLVDKWKIMKRQTQKTRIYAANLPDEWKDMLDGDEGKLARQNKQLKQDFDLEVSYKWRFMYFVFGPCAFLAFFVYKFTIGQERVMKQDVEFFGLFNIPFYTTIVLVTLIGAFLDVVEVWNFGREIVCFSNVFLPKIEVDMREEVNKLFIGDEEISLRDINEIHLFDYKFIYIRAFLLLLGILPYNLIVLCIKDLYFPFDIMRIASLFMGTFVIFRSFLTYTLFLKIYHALGWTYNPSFEARDNVGVALSNRTTRLMVFNFGFISFFVISICIAVVDASQWLVGTSIAFIALMIFSTLLGCSHSLPITPHYILSSLRKGVWIRVNSRVKCPCIYWCAYCSSLHQVDKMMILFPRNEMRFLEMLRGQTE